MSLPLRRLLSRTTKPSLSLSLHQRTFTTTLSNRTSWSPGPSPPRLPKAEQEIHDQLLKQSTGAFSTPSSQPRVVPQINQSPNSTVNPEMVAHETPESEVKAKVVKGEELHPNVRRGAPPEFEGDVNPKTGEVGGPKNEPLRWGHTGDWSYNGRATDF